MKKLLEIAASSASVDAKLKALAIVLDKTLPELESKVVTVEKLQGPEGAKGDKGDKGAPGEAGKPGKDGLNGKDGKDGKDGEQGKDGVSVVDAYIDFDNSLVLKLSDDSEINTGVLEYNKSTETLYATASQTFSPDSFPLAASSPKPSELIVKQNGEWVRATWTQFTAWIGAIGVVNKILTEGGDFLVAEDGSYLIEE